MRSCFLSGALAVVTENKTEMHGNMSEYGFFHTNCFFISLHDARVGPVRVQETILSSQFSPSIFSMDSGNWTQVLRLVQQAVLFTEPSHLPCVYVCLKPI